jgi:hypothetical protein
MKPQRIFTAVTLALVASALSAQDTTGTIAGRVTDKNGAPLAGIRVVLTAPSMLGERLTRTDANGTYRVPLLPNGHYTITADSADYLGSKGTFQILAGQTAHFDLSLRARKDVEKVQSVIVEVIGTAAQVDKSDTVTQTNFSTDTLFTMGTNDTPLALLGALTPGISTSNLASQSTLSVRGGTGHGTKTLLNGATMTEEGGGYLLETGTLPDMVDSMSVILSPLNARFGNTDGGIVNMVTTKGTNTFQGSIRANISRPDWTANNTPYANRLGVAASWDSVRPQPSDPLQKEYEITIKGPLWKDHITFAYGGKIIPNTYYPDPLTVLQNSPSQSSDNNGIFFQDPANGATIRRSNLWAQGKMTTDVSAETYNQFILFFQLNANHSVEWNYTQDNSDYISNYGVIDGNMRGNDAYKVRTWNLGYKGIIGSNGVLEGRYAHTSRAFPHPYSPDSPPIYVYSYPTGTPDANGKYAASSLPEGLDNGGASVNTHGYITDAGDTFKAETLSINYQHMLEAKGQHMIDVGIQQELFRWDTQATGNALQFTVPGQIAPNLTASDITGATGPVNPAAYAGKYIVFNSKGNLEDIDASGYAGTGPIIGSSYDQTGGASIVPQVRELYGNESGAYWMVTNSLYLNDLWTLNEHHSIMGGIRYDKLTVKDTVKTIANYSLPTLRFEYKYDISGDNTRLINVSFGQFHSRQPGSLFYPMVTGRLANSRTYYWTGTAPSGNPNAPYLVDQAAILNLNNYGYLANQTVAGQTFQVDPNWKAPVSNELSVGYRRTYQNGGFLRATYIHRSWSNLFDFEPGTVYQTPSGDPGLHGVLKNDASLNRNYNSVEAEWLIPFTHSFSFGGNYTFARLVSNVRNMVDSPARGNTFSGNSMNWKDVYSTFLPVNQGNVETLRNPQHIVKWYATFDLSSGKVKSSLALLGSYTSGLPMSRTFSYTTPYPTVPGYHDATNSQTGGLFNVVTQYNSPGQFTNRDIWGANLTYNVEFPIVRSMVLFLSAECDNVLNIRTPTAYTIPGQAKRDTFGATPTNNPYGYQMGANLSAVGSGGSNSGYSTTDAAQYANYYRYGMRTFKLQTGLRF